MEKLLDLSNDGLNITMDSEYVYLRCRNEVIKYSLNERIIKAQNKLFKKDGKARYITISENYVCVLDFCDLYILNKIDLTTVKYLKIGIDASTDLVAARCDDINVYISVRNGIIGVFNIEKETYNQYDLCDGSAWDLTLSDDKIYLGTSLGTLYEIDKTSMKVIRQVKIGKMNIYGVIVNENYVWTISQDKTIKVIDLNNFEVIKKVNKAVNGMCRILGLCNGNLVIADQGISLWDINLLIKKEKISIPTGHFNKGACLYKNVLIYSDYDSIYRLDL